MTEPIIITVNAHAEKSGRWNVTMYGYPEPKYFTSGSLLGVMLKVAHYVEVAQRPERKNALL